MSIDQHLHHLLSHSHEFDIRDDYHFHPRTITLLEHSRVFAIQFLNHLTPNDIENALDDLKLILQLGENLLFDDQCRIYTIEDEAKNMLYDDYLTLQFIFENHINEAQNLELKSTLNENQFYCLLALYNYANAYRYIDKTAATIGSPPQTNILTADAMSLAMSAFQITTHVYESIFGELSAKKIKELTEKTLKQSEGGHKSVISRYGTLEERAERNEKEAKKIVALAKEEMNKSPHLPAESIKKCVATRMGISISTINNRVPKFAKKLKNLSI